MGRSVNVPSQAAVVAYDHIEFEDELDAQMEWDWFKENAFDRIKEIVPSMQPAKGWLGNEGIIIAENGHATFGVSEYCGLISLWLVPDENSSLAESWCAQIAPKFLQQMSSLRKVGQFSNGEAVFERIAQ